MPAGRLYGPREISAADLSRGRVEPYYRRVLVRLLCAHGMAEKLVVQGYARAREAVADPALGPALEEALARERRHAALVFHALEDLGVSEQSAERIMVSALKGPSFEAPRHFAERARGEMDLMMAGLALDVTGLLMVGINYRESSYAPHSRLAELVLEEAAPEPFALEPLGRALERFGREAVDAALVQWLARAVNFFGPPGSGFTFDCLRYGLKARDNRELADLYLTLLERRAGQLGLRLPRLTASYPHGVA